MLGGLRRNFYIVRHASRKEKHAYAIDGSCSPVYEMDLIKFTTPYVARENDKTIPRNFGI